MARQVIVRVSEWDEESQLADEVVRTFVKTAISVGGEVEIDLDVQLALRRRQLQLRADWFDDHEPHHDDWLLNIDPSPDEEPLVIY